MKNAIASQIIGLALVGLATISSGCRVANGSSDRRFTAWEGETLNGLAKPLQNVVLICIYENRLKRMPLPYNHRIDSKATVVNCYKGNLEHALATISHVCPMACLVVIPPLKHAHDFSIDARCQVLDAPETTP